MCDSYTGDVREQARTSVFAWEAAERGQEVHPIADPSQAEMLRKKFDDKKTTLKEVKWVCCCFGSGRGVWLGWVGVRVVVCGGWWVVVLAGSLHEEEKTEDRPQWWVVICDGGDVFYGGCR